jgi:hypothetical protein
VARVPRRDPVAAIWKMPVTLRNQHGVGCRQSAPDASSSSDCVLAWLLAVSGIVPSREISPEASRSRRLRDAPISCRRKAPTAMRNAAHTRSGGVSTARSLSTGLTPFSPRPSPSRWRQPPARDPGPPPRRRRPHTRSGSRGPARPRRAASPTAPDAIQGLSRHGRAVAAPQGDHCRLGARPPSQHSGRLLSA